MRHQLPRSGIVNKAAETLPAAASGGQPRMTPDGRYIVVRGRLWRRSNPHLDASERQSLVDTLMQARRSVQKALRSGDDVELRLARLQVQAAKVALGERGPVWWTDGSPDLNRRMARNTGYAEWYAALEEER
jgi:hypothetical protein